MGQSVCLGTTVFDVPRYGGFALSVLIANQALKSMNTSAGTR